MTPRINGLDHVNIQTRALAATAAFFRDVLDLEPRDPPANLDPLRVRWMYDADGRAIFHLTEPGSLLDDAGDATLIGSTGAVHHVALDCSGHDAMIARLERLGLDHRRSYAAPVDLRQIFVHDPNGVLLELNYKSGNH
ncbi:MAG: VOC family protein [Janthinobacterium lividum]